MGVHIRYVNNLWNETRYMSARNVLTRSNVNHTLAKQLLCMIYISFPRIAILLEIKVTY